ncbi:hypothetical protein PsYK624_060760 [Phanerochaete sordida]|uniref:BTB domain-containing protein n=1 Tax=Phanerochaete sordida TaxID=48140 RepID=A0A9P3G7Y4_9APHY|nr:hypothetical protein PsYK624_060760 [Phanerochaete sordida]
MSEASGTSDNGQLAARASTPIEETREGGDEQRARDEEQVVAVSNVFHPSANLLPGRADTVLLSSDHVFFYVASSVLRQHSTNSFSHPLPDATLGGDSADDGHLTMIAMREDRHTVNVMVHTLYGLPCTQFEPCLDALAGACAGLHARGVPLAAHIAPGTPLFAHLVARVPSAPLFVYTLAGEHDLYALAQQAAPHLLSTKLDAIPDACTARMGPLYLHRLLALQMRRVAALRAVLAAPPLPHPQPVLGCDSDAQERVANAWLLTSGHLIWDARPELTPTSMDVTFTNVGRSIRCYYCKRAYTDRLTKALNDWEQVPRTI